MFLKKIITILLFASSINFHETEAAFFEKIVGGWPANPGEFPYQVSLRVNGKHTCGGSIISNLHILTAAHCVADLKKNSDKSLSVVSGTNKLFEGGEFHKICKITIHPDYKSGSEFSWHNDIAIITLTKAIIFNQFQTKINLPSKNLESKFQGIITGWGLTFALFETVPNQLQKLKTLVCPFSVCQDYLPVIIHKEQICGIQQTGSGVCSGDSGGPLVIKKEVVGIASWVVPCAKGYPDIYTNVFSYKDFITGEMRSTPTSCSYL